MTVLLTVGRGTINLIRLVTGAPEFSRYCGVQALSAVSLCQTKTPPPPFPTTWRMHLFRRTYFHCHSLEILYPCAPQPPKAAAFNHSQQKYGQHTSSKHAVPYTHPIHFTELHHLRLNVLLACSEHAAAMLQLMVAVLLLLLLTPPLCYCWWRWCCSCCCWS
jgi:hypothetical protein